MSPEQIQGRAKRLPLPRRCRTPSTPPGGQVFPAGPRRRCSRALEALRTSSSTCPKPFIPEFPGPPSSSRTRPDPWATSPRGRRWCRSNNFHGLFKDLNHARGSSTACAWLVTAAAAGGVSNPTDDRKSINPSLGVACLDCHVNGHTPPPSFHLNPDDPARQAAPLPAWTPPACAGVQPAADPRLQAQPGASVAGLHRVSSSAPPTFNGDPVTPH